MPARGIGVADFRLAACAGPITASEEFHLALKQNPLLAIVAGRTAARNPRISTV